jgi:phosphatidylethanolamine/phosphatidyl-N-methylethanolamine N-methyltransferase
MHGKFFLEFIKNRKTIGAVAPSSAALARTIVADANLTGDSVVVEYGPGTGSFTREILKKIDSNTTFFAIEKNPRMAEMFKRNFPSVRLYEDTVENVPQILREIGASQVDCIISGLPWASFESSYQERLLQTTLSVLRDGGTFSTFTYLQSQLLPAGRKFKKKIKSLFSQVHRTPIVWKAIPPAFVYRCIK